MTAICRGARSLARHAPVIVAAVILWASALGDAAAQTQDEFFNDSALQEVRLSINARDWQTLKDTSDEDTYYPADLRWRGLTVRNLGIRSRGGGTRNGIKPGLRVDFNRYVSNQEFLGLKAVVLDNAYADPTLVRESVTMKVFMRLGLPASREAHARLYVNDEFAGVFNIVESVDRTFVTRVFGALEGEVERGGYLFKYEWASVYGFEDLGAALEPYAAVFKPETRDTDSMFGLYQPIADMTRTINESSDDRFASDVGSYLDLRRLMMHLAVQDFMAEIDGFVGNWGLNNFYLYRFRAQGRPAVIIPWDEDGAFLDVPEHPIDYHIDTDVLVRRAMRVPELRQLYLDTLLQCAGLSSEQVAGDSRGWLEREVDRQARQVEPAVAEDPVFPFSVDQFESAADEMRTFARARPGLVGCQVANARDPLGPQQLCARPLP